MFGERLRYILDINFSTPEDLAKKVGVPVTKVFSWIEGTAYPDADQLVAICILFNVSSDYLMGFVEYKQLKVIKKS